LKKRLIIIAVLLLVASGTTYYVSSVRSQSVANERKIANGKKQPKKFIDKKTAEQINRKFYSHEEIQGGGEMAFVKYPSNFSKMIESGQLTIVGIITGLNSFVSDHQPYTIADVGVERVLRGDSSQQNKIIRVMFLGGNITKKEMLAPIADKNFMDTSEQEATSDEVVTVEQSNNRLPRAGEKVALVLSKTQAGTNNIPGEFWLTVFANKSIFFKDTDGQYRRTPEAKSFGGGGSGEFSENDFNAKDDKKMNDGMNELINSK